MPILQANIADTGDYGLAQVPVKPYTTVTLPAPSFNKRINVAILGIGNHRVPNYELPSNIPGLTFSDPMAAAQALARLDATLVEPALVHLQRIAHGGR